MGPYLRPGCADAIAAVSVPEPTIIPLTVTTAKPLFATTGFVVTAKGAPALLVIVTVRVPLIGRN